MSVRVYDHSKTREENAVLNGEFVRACDYTLPVSQVGGANRVAPSGGDSGHLCTELRGMGRLSGNAVYDEAASSIERERKRAERAEDALREWQLGVGDTEMEAENKRLNAEIAARNTEWWQAMRDVVELRARAERAEAILRELRERITLLVRSAYRNGQDDVPDDRYYGITGTWEQSDSMEQLSDLLAWLDEREKR
jgi:hypothetical protein